MTKNTINPKPNQAKRFREGSIHKRTPVTKIFTKAKAQYGDRAWSSMVVKLLEDICSADLRAEGFPSELIDQSQKIVGKEI